MTRRTLQNRLGRIATRLDPPIPHQFTAFARAVINFCGNEPTPDTVAQLARWYAGGYRERGNRVASPFLMTPYRALSDGPEVS
jgi:hypothetical protein